MRLPWTPVSDEEYVEQVRRGMALYDRLRVWFVLFNVFLVCGVGWLFSKQLLILRQFAPAGNIQAIPPILILAVTVGLSLGWIFGHALHGLFSWVGGFRSERLLVQYHDALASNRPSNQADLVEIPHTDDSAHIGGYDDDKADG